MTAHALVSVVLCAIGLTSLPAHADDIADAKQPRRLQTTKPTSGRFVATDQGYMVPYQATIPGTEVRFRMQPVPGHSQVRNDKDQIVTPAIEPFWMAAHEVTWAEYVQYMAMYNAMKAAQKAKQHEAALQLTDLDAITAPTEIYEPNLRFEFLRGPRTPATSMTQYAARQYTHWLSAVSKQTFFLPTEREWRHACLAGAKTPWSMGNDVRQLETIARYRQETNDESVFEGPAKVGSKKPNAWGLYDMHGNVAEWVIQHESLSARPPKLNVGPRRGQMYRWIACGGSWDHPAQQCRATSVLTSDTSWWNEDAGIPFSPWWTANTDILHQVGFRMMSPLGKPSARELRARWGIDTEQLLEDVDARLQDGRGAAAKFTGGLIRQLEQLKENEDYQVDRPWERYGPGR